jgi:hypothetical protein
MNACCRDGGWHSAAYPAIAKIRRRPIILLMEAEAMNAKSKGQQPAGTVIRLTREIDLGSLGRIPLRLSFSAHAGQLEICEVHRITPGGDEPFPQLDLIADALGLWLDPMLMGQQSAA